MTDARIVAPDGDRPTQALSDRVRGQISDLIHSRALSGGEIIIEQRLAEQLGVSRTPLREALQRLEGEGMVQKLAGRSFMVRKVDFQEYLQAFRVRLLLEPEAAALAAPRVVLAQVREIQDGIAELRALPGKHTQAHWDSDDALHGLIGMACGNAVLHRTIEELRITTRLYEIEDVRQRVEADHDQHEAIVGALAKADAAGAREAMADHLRSLIAYSISHVG